MKRFSIFVFIGVGLAFLILPLNSNLHSQISEIVLDASHAKNLTGGVRIVDDKDTSIKKAIEFYSGPSGVGLAHPTNFFEMEFEADAGTYYIWIRGKSDGDVGSDSIWIQFDDEIGTNSEWRAPGKGLGNWRDVAPPGKYCWGSNLAPPISVESVTFKTSGKHKLRTQPRQVKHRIDQIWLSSTKYSLKPSKNSLDLYNNKRTTNQARVY